MKPILISHRGNISGINSKRENRMDYIFESLKNSEQLIKDGEVKAKTNSEGEAKQ